jgi:MATE family multidrug resistance protein
MMVVFMHFLLNNDELLKKYLHKFSFKEVRKSMLKKIINLGFPSAMQMLFEVALFTTAIWLSGSLGKNSQAANQIALILSSSTFMVAMGLSVASMIRVGYAKGLNKYKDLIIIARSLFLLTIIIESVFALLFLIFHNFLPHLFLNMTDVTEIVDNNEIIWIASRLLLVAAVFQIFDGVQVVVLGALRGLQDVKIPMYITFIAYWLIGFPISFYLGKYTDLKAIGIWIGLLAGLSSAALFLYIRFARLTKRLVLENSMK